MRRGDHDGLTCPPVCLVEVRLRSGRYGGPAAVPSHSAIVGGKITFVHRRLWPALVRIAPHVSRRQLARLTEVHTASGRHKLLEQPFPDWVPALVRRQAHKLTESKAASALGKWVPALVRPYATKP